MSTAHDYISTFSGHTIWKAWTDEHHAEFIRHDTLGLCLFLDGIIQSSETDQSIYHDKLVRAALEEKPDPERVLIVGGTGGGVLHHLFRHVNTDSCAVTVVDVDEKLFRVGEKLMASWSAGEVHQRNVDVMFENGADHLARATSEYDIILVDVADPIPATRSNEIYSTTVLGDISSALKPKGVLAFHSSVEETFDHVFVSSSMRGEGVLRKISHFPVYIPSFECTWMFHTLKKGIF